VCIPPAPPDLDCKDVPYRRFQVLAPDPHNFDRDDDGIGCES
jgi:micrococcal nuclease